MIIGIGSDLVDVRRIEKMLSDSGVRFIERCFSEAERKKAESRKEGGLEALTYAKRFAAKEACAKALGTGIGLDAGLKDIEISNDERGKPAIVVSGAALARLNSILPPGAEAAIHLTLSDESDFAQAFVVIEARVR